MKGALFLDVVVRQSTTILKLLSRKNETLLVWRNSFLVLDLRLHVINSIRRFYLECDSLSRKGLHEDLHSTTKSENKVKGRFLLDVVVRQGTAILKLLSSEDKALLVRGDSLLVLNLRLHIVDGVGGFDFECDSLSSKGLNEDLHTTTETQDEMKGGLLLNVVVGQSAAVFKLFTSEDQTLLVRRNTLFILDLCLDIVDGVARLNLKGDSLASEGLDDCESKLVCESLSQRAA